MVLSLDRSCKAEYSGVMEYFSSDSLLKPHLIAYFDILGYKAEIQKCEGEFLTKILFGMMSFRLGMDTLEKMTKSAETIMMADGETIKYKLFSDNFILYVPETGNKKLDDYNNHLLIDACLNIECHFCKLGLKLRGAITKGSMFAGKSFVFGSGLVKAVTMEEQAEFPIIILDDCVSQPVGFELPIRNDDRINHLDYLEYYRNRCLSSLTDSDQNTLNGFLARHKEMVRTIPSTGKELRKRQFLIDYHNQFCEKYNLGQFIVLP